MNYLKFDNMANKNKEENIQFNMFEIEPCETEDFEVNPDADERIIDVSEDEYDEVMREQRRKDDKKDRTLTFLRIFINLIISLLIIYIIWYFCD